MSLAAAIHDFMSDGLSVGQRVYPLAVPQHVTYPAIVYRVISDDPTITHSSAQDAPTYTGAQHSFTRVQFDCIAQTYDGAEALADELVQYASGYKGLWGDVEVDAVWPELRIDDWDPDPALYRIIQDLMIGHRTAAQS